MPLFRPLSLAGLVLACLALGVPACAAEPKEGTLVAAFQAVALGVEIAGPFGGGAYLKRFETPVRVRIEAGAAQDRTRDVERFVRRLDRDISGLSIALARSPREANFVVHVVDAADYQRAGRRIFGNPFLRVPGRCIVRSTFGRAGIRRSDALIVSDVGEGLFRRCLSEEVLQGLGLLADTEILGDSVFNDASRIERPTRADMMLAEMLYDRRLSSGMEAAALRGLLPDVARDARRRKR